MSVDIKVKSLTPVNAGWWAKYFDEDGLIWYSPVAAWALCTVKYGKQRDGSDEILPVLTSETGMEPHHPSAGHCDIVYLPDAAFVMSDEPGVFAWYLERD